MMFLLFYFQASQPNNEFIITFKKGAKKTDSMRFSSDQRAAIITEAMRWVIIRKYLTYIDSFQIQTRVWRKAGSAPAVVQLQAALVRSEAVR